MDDDCFPAAEVMLGIVIVCFFAGMFFGYFVGKCFGYAECLQDMANGKSPEHVLIEQSTGTTQREKIRIRPNGIQRHFILYGKRLPKPQL